METYSYNYISKNNNWRKMKEDNFYHNNQQQGAASRARSQNKRRPSLGWQPFSWEKKFCATAGVPWQKVLETKKYMYMDKDQKVLLWNDSAVEEAFWNAKNRFWAELHGQPCNIKLPDPDIFIDNVDWDSDVDPQLILDLEKRESDSSHKTQKGGDVVVFGIPVVPEQYVAIPTGWGDEEEAGQQLKNEEKQDEKGCEDDRIYVNRNWSNNQSTRDHSYTQADHGYNNKWDHGQWNMSRYKISRFNNNRKYGPSLIDDYGSKRGNFAYERPLVKWRPVSRQW